MFEFIFVFFNILNFNMFKTFKKFFIKCKLIFKAKNCKIKIKFSKANKNLEKYYWLYVCTQVNAAKVKQNV